MKIEKHTCPVCDSEKSRYWGEAFRKCKNCGVCYRAIMPSSEELNDIYADCYSKNNISIDSTDMCSADESLYNHAYFVSRLVKPSSLILDYGAGTGKFMNQLIEYGFSVHGCESSPDARVVANNLYGLKFYSSLEEGLEKYDLIVAIEVIEHLTNPAEIIKKLYEYLKPGGIIYITTPNINGLKARIKKDKWSEAVKSFHLIFFNYKSIKRLLEGCGFRAIEYLRFSPLTVTSPAKIILHRVLQLLGLYGGLRILARKPLVDS